MYQKNLGRQIWAILSPMLVYNVVVYIVQLIFCGIIYVQNLDKIAALVGTPEEVRMAAAKIIYDVIIEYPVEMMERAIKGMLPHNRLGRQMYKKLFVYEGAEHPHAAQQPKEIKVGRE